MKKKKRLLKLFLFIIIFPLWSTSYLFLSAFHKDESFYFGKRRLQILSQLSPKEGLLIFSGGFETKKEVEIYPFRQESNFFYLTGVHQKKSALLLYWHGQFPMEILFVTTPPSWLEKWIGSFLKPGYEGSKKTGILEVKSFSQLKSTLQNLKSSHPTLYTNAQEMNPSFYSYLEKSRWNLKNSSPLLLRQRLVKDSLELQKIQKAVDITTAAHFRAMKKLRPYLWEYQLQAEVEYVFLYNGAKRPAFTSIIGSGKNSCILHYNQNQKKMLPGELVVVDIGAEYDRYAADLIRTLPVSGRFTQRQKEIYQIVLDAQKAALQEVKPGSNIRRVHMAARKFIEKNGYGAYFPHGTSHWMGLDVHDPCPYHVPFKPGMVLTVEPGIYLSKEKFGIRIEDDVLVTKTGYKLLSRRLPKEIRQIEQIMKKGWKK